MIGLEENRTGALSDQQRQNLGALSRYRRRNAATIALFLLAVAAILLFAPNPRAPLAERELIAMGAGALAAFLIVRAVTGDDRLTRDLRESRVESVEGAIGKRRVGGGRARDTYYLDVGERTFKVGPGTYHDAPDAGWVRAYYLPLSRTIVNLERIQNASPPPQLTRDGIIGAIGATLSGNRREANEARAGIATVADTLKAAFDGSSESPPAAARDPRPLDQAIVGTWRNPIVHATFAEGGTLSFEMFGKGSTGRWSVDGQGRLIASILGQEHTTNAWIAGDQLTIDLGSRTVTLTREGS